MISVWWSIVLTMLGGLGWLLVTVERRIAGFCVGLTAQVAWVAYAVATAQWGFIGSAALFGAINALGVHRWLRARRAWRDRDAGLTVLNFGEEREPSHVPVPPAMELPCPSTFCRETLTITPATGEVTCPRCGCTVRQQMSDTPRRDDGKRALPPAPGGHRTWITTTSRPGRDR